VRACRLKGRVVVGSRSDGLERASEGEGGANRLVRQRLSDQVLERLTGLIASGELEPGAALPAVAALAKRFGVSTHIAREAIAGLAARGLVQVAHGRGCFVAPRSQWRLVDAELIALMGSEQALPALFEVRQTFEVGMASLAARRRTEADLAELAAVLRRAREDPRPETQVECDGRFHRALARATHNPLFQPLLAAIMGPLRQYFVLSQRFPDTAERTTRGHQAIYECIARGDEEGAARAMVEHLRAGREICERIVRLSGAADQHEGEEVEQQA
jgi:DNA-binding FadR family transcriptional regulator